MKNRYLISVDIEGISGVAHSEFSDLKGSQYEIAKKYMTNDVNAVIKGIYEADLKAEVIVRDAHGSATNLNLSTLDERASLIQGWGTNSCMAHPVDSSFCGLFLVGYHAGGNNQTAVLAHTYSRYINYLKVNGKFINEAGIAGLHSGYYKVPILFLSGDDQAVMEAREQFEKIVAIPVKESYARDSTLSYSLKKTSKELAEGAYNATRNSMDKLVPPFILPPPLETELQINSLGYIKSLYANLKDVLSIEEIYSFDDADKKILFKAKSGLEVLKRFNLIISLIFGLKP